MIDNRTTAAQAPEAPSAVRLAAVSKTYESKATVVQALLDINLDLKQGETVAVVGPSGCGKSTLLRIMSGIEKPSTGELWANGKRMSGPVQDVGYVFQDDLLLEWKTVLANVLLPAQIRGGSMTGARKRAQELVDELELSDFSGSHPWQLSGGMRQRVAIARALLLEPSLLFLDEPFSALDALTRDQMNVTLQGIALSGTATTLLITHSIVEAIFIADRVLVMSPRPGVVLEEIQVPFERPRKLGIRETPEFAEIAKRIRQIFEEAGVFTR